MNSFWKDHVVLFRFEEFIEKNIGMCIRIGKIRVHREKYRLVSYHIPAQDRKIWARTLANMRILLASMEIYVLIVEMQITFLYVFFGY